MCFWLFLMHDEGCWKCYHFLLWPQGVTSITIKLMEMVWDQRLAAAIKAKSIWEPPHLLARCHFPSNGISLYIGHILLLSQCLLAYLVRVKPEVIHITQCILLSLDISTKKFPWIPGKGWLCFCNTIVAKIINHSKTCLYVEWTQCIYANQYQSPDSHRIKETLFIQLLMCFCIKSYQIAWLSRIKLQNLLMGFTCTL